MSSPRDGDTSEPDAKPDESVSFVDGTGRVDRLVQGRAARVAAIRMRMADADTDGALVGDDDMGTP